MSLCYSLNAWLVTARNCSQNVERSPYRALLWQLLQKIEKDSHTYSSENSVAETTAFAPSGMLDHAELRDI